MAALFDFLCLVQLQVFVPDRLEQAVRLSVNLLFLCIFVVDTEFEVIQALLEKVDVPEGVKVDRKFYFRLERH